MFSVVGLMILLAAVVGAGTMVGSVGWLINRIRRIESRTTIDQETLEMLLREMEQLRDQSDGVREELAELHERVDFTERLLTKGDGAAGDRR